MAHYPKNTSNWPTGFLSAFSMIILSALLICQPSNAAAKAWYVTPRAELPVRTGQGTEYKIIEIIHDGAMVEILEENEFWARIRTAGNKEGWFLKRYLSEEPPLKEVVANLREQQKESAAKETKLTRQLTEVSEAYSLNQGELKQCLAAKKQTETAYQTLKQDTADVIKIKHALEDTIHKNEELKKNLAITEQENRELKKSRAIKWFMSGSGVLLIGWLIGLVTGRSSRRRQTSLL